jgi:hypothetical protein
MSVWSIAAWLCVFWVGLACGQIYKWVDRQGNVHFTDNPSRIPPEYQTKVEVETSTPPAPASTGNADATPSQPPEVATPAASPSAPPPKDRLGRGPDYWQQLAQYWSAQLQQLLQQRDQLQRRYDYTRTLAHTTRAVDARGPLEAEVARLEPVIADTDAGINKARTMLQTTLPQEARRLGAQPEWLKPAEMTRQ